MTLAGILKKNAAAIGDRSAVIYRDNPITYGELEARASRFAHALEDLGIRRGTKGATMLNH